MSSPRPAVPTALPDPAPDECLFCGIVAGRVPSVRLAEDERTVAFLDAFPGARGHALVVPRAHARDLMAAPDEDLAACLVAAADLAARLVPALGATGVNVVNACGSSSGQSVPHLHLHVLPRYDDDAVPHPWTPRRASPEELQELGRVITAG